MRISCWWRRSRSGNGEPFAVAGAKPPRRSGCASVADPRERARTARVRASGANGRESDVRSAPAPCCARAPASSAAKRAKPSGGEEVGEPEAEVRAVAGEHLVAALAVQHHGQSRPLRGAQDVPTRCDRRRAERLALRLDDPRQVADEVGGPERDPVRVRLRAVDDRLRVGPLVEARILEEDGERALPVADGQRVLVLVAEQPVDGDDDRGRVDPAREARPDGDVAAQPQAHGVEEQLAHGLRRVAGRRVVWLEAPVAGQPQAAVVEDERVGRRQAADPGEERLVRVVEVRLLEVVADDGAVRLEPGPGVGAEGARLAREGEPVAVEAVVEGLDAEAVARAEEPRRFGRPRSRTPTSR